MCKIFFSNPLTHLLNKIANSSIKIIKKNIMKIIMFHIRMMIMGTEEIMRMNMEMNMEVNTEVITAMVTGHSQGLLKHKVNGNNIPHMCQ